MRLDSDLQPGSEIAIPVVARPRLAFAFAFSAGTRVMVLLAPAGFGKSIAVRSFLCDSRWVHYRVSTRGATFARFVRGFAQAVVEVAPGAQASFTRAWERASQSGSPESVLARWLCGHLHDVDADIVIDDLHDAASDSSIAAFIAEFVRVRADRRLAIVARAPGLLPIPLWMATGIMERPLDEDELRFNVSEARALSAALGRNAADAEQIVSAAAGSPIGVAYAIATTGARPVAGRDLQAVRSFDQLARQIFAACDPRQRQFLLSISLLPALNVELLEACGWTDWRGLCSTLAGNAPFMWENGADGIPRFYDRFADYLALQMTHEEPSLRITLAQHAVQALERSGRHADALRVAAHQKLAGDLNELLEKHGFDILESGRVDEISEALQVIDSSESFSAGAVVMAIRGYIDARLGRLDTAEAWFRLGLERAANDEVRVGIALYYARQLMHQYRDDAFEVLEPYADSATLSPELLMDVRSSLGQAYMVADRAREARVRSGQAMRMLEAECPAALRARVLARAAYVAFESGEAAEAREYALLAAPIALAERLYDVATSVYTVLYTTAYEIDDDPAACRKYIERIRDCGMKSGTIRLDLYTLVALYELESEAGDRARLAELDRAISVVDVNYATPAFLESFLPARALQAGWAGDFAYAQDMLKPTADRQATPFRKALRWSEVAVYAAAAGDRSSALGATAAADTYIGEGGARTTHLAFALLNCALAFWVLGDLPQCRSWAARAADESIPGAERVGAFRRTVACMLDVADDPQGCAGAMPPALAALRASGFGGIALLVESLAWPQTVLAFSPEPIEIGTYLALQHLDLLYAAAVASNAAEAPLFDWLRRSCEPEHVRARLRPLLLRWAPPVAVQTLRSRLLLTKIQRLVAARSPMSAVVATLSREEDVDARIDLLFAELQQAFPLMAEHSQAVSAWCTRIARRLGLDETEIAYVTRCGLIHDIGKIHTPAAIIEAPRRLDAQEWTVMADHAAEGGRIAARVPALVRFVPIIRGHHERLDGNGYPDGLRGDAIPLAARIVTVADCFNAMIGRRSYRLPMTPTAAIEELDRNRHTQFDPDIVEAMIWIVMGRVPQAVKPELTAR